MPFEHGLLARPLAKAPPQAWIQARAQQPAEDRAAGSTGPEHQDPPPEEDHGVLPTVDEGEEAGGEMDVDETHAQPSAEHDEMWEHIYSAQTNQLGLSLDL